MLRQSLHSLSLQTSGEGFTDLTGALNREISASGLKNGLATLASLHTSCSLTINENADPRVLEDLATFLRALVPAEGVRPLSGRGELRPWRHEDEGRLRLLLDRLIRPLRRQQGGGLEPLRGEVVRDPLHHHVLRAVDNRDVP